MPAAVGAAFAGGIAAFRSTVDRLRAPSEPASGPPTAEPATTGAGPGPTPATRQPRPAVAEDTPASATGIAGSRRPPPPPRSSASPGSPARPTAARRIGTSIAGRELQVALVGVMVLALVGGARGPLLKRQPGGRRRRRGRLVVAAGVGGRRCHAATDIRASIVRGRRRRRFQRTDGTATEPTRRGETAKPTAKPTKAPATAATASRTYRVKAGDTLSAIAAKYKTTVAKLMALNNISDPRSLRVGQILKIP